MKKIILAICSAVLCFAGNFEDAVKEYYAGNYENASGLFEKSCVKDKNAAGCFLQAFMTETSGGDYDKNEVASLYIKSCEGGDMYGCDAAGAVYAGAKSYGDADMQKAIPYYEKACKGGVGNSCWVLAEYYVYSKSDAKKAEEYYKIGCDSKNGAACSSLASLYDTKKIEGVSAEKIMEYYGLGCDYGDYYSCSQFRSKFKEIKR